MRRLDLHTDHHPQGDQAEFQDCDDLPVAGRNITVGGFKQSAQMLYLRSFSACPNPGCPDCSILICATDLGFFFVSLPHTGDACNHGLIVLGCKVQDANVYSVIQDTMFIE